RLVDLQSGARDRLIRRPDGVLDEVIHLLELLLLDVVLALEVAALAGDPGREVGGVEAGDPADARAAVDEPVPVPVDAGTERRDQTETGDDDATPGGMTVVHRHLGGTL